MVCRYLISIAAWFVIFSKVVNAAEWSGQIAVESRIFTESPADTRQHGDNFSGFFQPEFYHAWNQNNDTFTFVPFLRLDQNDSQRTHFDIRELTWLKVVDQLEWRVGIRKVFWGVTESQHLVDIINQTDAVENPDGEDKLGQPMLNMSYASDLGTVDIFVLPYFRERTYPGQRGRLRTIPRIDTDNPVYESSNKEKNIDYALRWAHSIGEWDIGLSYFDGTSRDPRLVPGVDSKGNSVWIPYYDLITQTGIDVQATFDKWLWKFEGIHRTGQGPTYNAATLGLEYTFYGLIDDKTDLGVVVEYLYDDRGISAPTPFQDDWMLGLRFTLNDEQSTEALFGVITDSVTDATIYYIEASRRLGESWKLTIESRSYHNIPQNDILYSYRKDDYLQIELGYFF